MVRVALVGVGSMGSGHLAQYQRLMKEGKDVKLVAVCDINPEQLKRKDNQLNIEYKKEEEASAISYAVYTDYLQMMDQEEIDYVDFATPTYLHAEMAIAALTRGKNVLCEKPMAYSVEQCENMIAAQKASGKVLMSAQCLRFWPAYEELRRAVQEKRYGEVISASFFRGGSTPMWSFENWLLKKELAGGALLDQHVHDTDTINWLFGIPEAVSTSGKNAIAGSGYDAVSTNYFYPDGKVVTAMDDWTINGDGFGFEMIFRVNFERGAMLMTKDGQLHLCPVGGKHEIADLPADDGYYREILYFMDCVTRGVQPDNCLPTSTCDTIRIAWAEQQSADNKGEKVNL